MNQELFPQTAAFQQQIRVWGARGQAALAARKGGVTAVAALVMLGAGVKAIAVDPLAELSAQPVTVISQAFELPSLDAQLEALANHHISLTRSGLTRKGESAAAFFQRLGVQDAPALAFLKANASAQALFSGDAGKMVVLQVNRHNQLQSLVARFAPADEALQDTHFQRIEFSRNEDGFSIQHDAALALEKRQRMTAGTLKSNTDFFRATDEAGLPTAVAEQLAQIFESSIDFRHAVAKGDSFKVLYETLVADGEPINWIKPEQKRQTAANQRRKQDADTGQVLAAVYRNKGVEHTAVWFEGQKKGYFDQYGQSLRRAYLSSPLAYSRVTSGFAMRVHPVLRTLRKHNGVDYAAAVGTPVRTVGDGVVSFAGTQRGYGNVLEITHSSGRSTLYAHLNRLHVKKGDRVQQGQVVADSGNTGLSSGPHLHFEFKLNGEQVDPLAILKANEQVTMAKADRKGFDASAQAVLSKLELTEPAQLVSRRSE